jgi:hypothetical protein
MQGPSRIRRSRGQAAKHCPGALEERVAVAGGAGARVRVMLRCPRRGGRVHGRRVWGSDRPWRSSRCRPGRRSRRPRRGRRGRAGGRASVPRSRVRAMRRPRDPSVQGVRDLLDAPSVRAGRDIRRRRGARRRCATVGMARRVRFAVSSAGAVGCGLGLRVRSSAVGFGGMIHTSHGEAGRGVPGAWSFRAHRGVPETGRIEAEAFCSVVRAGFWRRLTPAMGGFLPRLRRWVAKRVGS